jgi:type I restriction enzyme S subunit
VDEREAVDASSSYPNLGIYSYGKGTFAKPPIDGSLTRAESLRRVRARQFIYSRLFAFEGAYAMVPSEFDGFYVSGEYPTFECDQTKVLPEFLWAYFRSPNVWKAIATASRGLGSRRQRVQPDRILTHRILLPPIEWQHRIAETQSKVQVLKGLQVETANKLNVMLPAILDKAFKGKL